MQVSQNYLGAYMQKLISIALALTLAFTISANAHGGGCRKDSPQGKCCHMEKRIGRVHCH
jgi:hypothetical protein